jgi:hypothetical protein
MKRVGERIYKSLIGLVMIPLVWILLLMCAALCVFIPIVAFFNPDSIKIGENNTVKTNVINIKRGG